VCRSDEKVPVLPWLLSHRKAKGESVILIPLFETDLRGKNEKKCLLKMESEKVHLHMIEKR